MVYRKRLEVEVGAKVCCDALRKASEGRVQEFYISVHGVSTTDAHFEKEGDGLGYWKKFIGPTEQHTVVSTATPQLAEDISGKLLDPEPPWLRYQEPLSRTLGSRFMETCIYTLSRHAS